ncbi:uncharacterized protein C8R40DRAFT_851344 [Lentinula edodes]|uniref:uncharacterized protein n=1 Tax=Lentinula edodes TaxID=5353 RepID=UPI001E8EF02A|nr:uncharacterized protein C8R40DRAFT_851344 [Lentinula edodes]KAH7868215.1 hypothetical protein C8R40DRAFT_851344 [Lentinula edodes]
MPLDFAQYSVISCLFSSNEIFSFCLTRSPRRHVDSIDDSNHILRDCANKFQKNPSIMQISESDVVHGRKRRHSDQSDDFENTSPLRPTNQKCATHAAHAIQCLYNSGVEDSQVKSQTWALSIYQHAASSNAQLLQSDNFEGTKGSLDSVAGHGEHPQSRDAAAIMVHSGAYYNMFLNSIEKAPFTTFEIESNAVMDGSEDVGTLEIKEHATSMSANDVSPSVPSTSTSAAATLTPSDPVTPTTSGITDDSAMSPVITPTLVPAKKASGFMKPGKSTSVR